MAVCAWELKGDECKLAIHGRLLECVSVSQTLPRSHVQYKALRRGILSLGQPLLSGDADPFSTWDLLTSLPAQSSASFVRPSSE